jgi:hypothetical protein
MQRLGVNIRVALLPNMKHADMINNPEAAQAITRAISPAEVDRR